MAEEGTRSLVIAAPPEVLFEAITDFASYPTWTGNVREAEILDHNNEGRACEVKYTARAVGMTVEYTLRYEFDEPTRLTWHLTSGRIRGPLVRASIRSLDGFYKFEPLDGGQTKATYKIRADLSIPIGPLRATGERIVMDSALKELKHYVES